MYKKLYPASLVLAVIGLTVIFSADFGVIAGIPMGLAGGVLYHFVMRPNRQKIDDEPGKSDTGDG